MKKFLALLLVAVLALTMVACKKDEADEGDRSNDLNQVDELVYNNLKYRVGDDGNYEIVGYVFGGVELLDIAVPADIEGRAITGIGADAFKGAKNIKSISLPASLQYIGDYAFYDCDYITAVVIPDSVVTVGTGVFQGCDALTTVTFSKSLTLVGDFAFKDCAKLQNPVLPEGLVSIGIGAFDGCKALTAVTIPTTVVKIGDTAFYGCSNLEAVTADVVVPDADTAILEKMNGILAAYETANNEQITNASAAFDVLENAGLYVGNADGRGIKYVWDKEAKQIVGAFSASDAALIAKMNATLASAKENPADTYKLRDLFTAAGLDADNLNDLIDEGKYQWNADTRRMERTYSIGENVFHATKAGFTVYANAGTPVAIYAQEYHTVAPIPVPIANA